VDEIVVFLALASPLVRLRLRHSLAQLPHIRLAGEASTMLETVQQLEERQPQILLTDRVLLKEPPLLTLLARRGAPLVILVTATDSELGTIPPTPVARTVSFTMPPHQLADQLRQALLPPVAPADSPPALVEEVRRRFHFSVAQEATATPAPAPEQPKPTSRQAHEHRRTPTTRHERLVVALQQVQRQQQRDSVTGLTGLAALQQVRALIPTAQQAVALIGVAVQDERGQTLTSPLAEVALLRRISATLRANVRREDLVCRIGPASFVVVLPGTRWEEATRPVERIRTALSENCQRQIQAAGAFLAVGVSYWDAEAGSA